MRLSLLIFLSVALGACGTNTELSLGAESAPESEANQPQQDGFAPTDDMSDDDASAPIGEDEEPNEDLESPEDNTNTSSNSGGPILVLGDSIMDWNVEEGTSIGHVVQERTEQPVTIRAVSGAHFASDEDDDIRSQYVEGDWSWVVFTGGGNDLNDRCGCGDCSGVLNELLSPDGASGAIVDAVDALRSTGVKVMFLTYYDLPPTAQFGFANCGDESEELALRASTMAQAREDVYWVDMGQVVFPTDLSAFDEDHVHPSERGSALIGELVADVIMAQP